MGFVAKAFGSLFSSPKPKYQAPLPAPVDNSAELAEQKTKEDEKKARRKAVAHSRTNLTGGLLADEEVKAQKKTLLSGGSAYA